MKFSVVGGDMRQVYLAQLLAADGHYVSVFGFGKTEIKNVITADNLKKAVENAEYVVLPVPALNNDGTVNAPLHDGEILPEEIFEYISPSAMAFAGNGGKKLGDIAAAKGICVQDFMLREEFALTNAAITAEGAVGIIIRQLDTTVAGAKILVVGYGRIGRQLAMKLRGLNARVTAAARKAADLSLITADGFDIARSDALNGNLEKFDVVINTVPAPVLTEKHLRQLKSNCFCLELASKPGGFDLNKASELGLKAMSAPGLPGKTAPLSAAKAMRDTIYNIVHEL